MNTDQTPSSRKLSYRRYMIVNIRTDEKLVPHLCVIVDDDDDFKAAVKDPHFQFILTDSGSPVRRDAYIPLTLTHSHSFAASEEQLQAEETALNADYEKYYVDTPESMSLTDMLLRDIDDVASKLLNSSAPDSENVEELPSFELTQIVDAPNDEEIIEYSRPEMNTYRTDECVDGNWVLEVPTAFIAMSHLIHEAYPDAAPAFLICSNKNFKASKAGQGYSFDDFDFIVEYENYNESHYSGSVAEILKLREGQYILESSPEDIGNAASILLDKVIRLATGEISAFEEAMELSEEFARLSKKDDDVGEQEKPAPEDLLLNIMLNILLDLYTETNSEPLFDTLYQSDVLTGFENTAQDLEEQSDIIDNMIEVERLFENDELQDLFKGIEVETASAKIPPYAKEADFEFFYSAPLTRGSFPESMRRIAEGVEFPFMYENSIMDADDLGEIPIISENAGQIFLSMITALAVRYGRMKMMKDHGLDFVPFNIFLKVLQDIYKINYLGTVVNFAILNIPTNGIALIREIAYHMPESQSDRVAAAQNVIPGMNIPVILSFPSVILLHYLNHMIIDDDLDIDKLIDSLSEDNPLRDYLPSIEMRFDNLRESEAVKSGACAELLTAVDLVLSTEMSSKYLADSVIDLLVKAGVLSVVTHTDLMPGTDEWNDYLVGFYTSLLNK